MVTFNASELHTFCTVLELLEKEYQRNHDQQKIIQSVTNTLIQTMREHRKL